MQIPQTFNNSCSNESYVVLQITAKEIVVGWVVVCRVDVQRVEVSKVEVQL